eukprot:GILI01034608.1.p2 GENE.GILI01034608.1~~GILI01034608.1.p2  ORF type:complete len:192 (+),score=44.27 GILI01034608.1:36-611(+)
MKIIKATQTVDIPAGVKVELKSRLLKVTGPRGSLSRNLRYAHLDMQITPCGKKIQVQSWFSSRKKLATIGTVCTHIRNMITGVTRGYRYKMRLVYAHFPINFGLIENDTVVEIRNFLGEKITRVVPMLDGVKVSRGDGTVKDELVLEGNDIQNVSQSAANIHCSTLVKGKDIRKFLDGIYVSESGPIPADE